MKIFRKVFFAMVVTSFIGWCMYYYLNEISSKLLVRINFYTFTVLEILMAVMGAFYIIVTFIALAGYLIYRLFCRFSRSP